MLYDIDFAALPVAEKTELVHHFGRCAQESFQKDTKEINWLAQLLIITRSRNSYRKLPEGNPEPEVIPLALEQIWNVLAGQTSKEEFCGFQKMFSASLLEFMAGDDSELVEDTESQRFHARYFAEWNHFYTLLADGICGLGEEITADMVNWRPIEELLYGDIGDNLIEYYEDVYQNGTGGYRPAELRMREEQAYSSPTFCRVVELMQQDMKVAIAGGSVLELKKRYAGEVLLPETK